MSDEEDDDYDDEEEEEEDEDDEDEEEEDEEDDNDEEEEARLAKEISVKQDVKNLNDTFMYIDKVVKRIGNHVQRDLRDEEERKKREEERNSKTLLNNKNKKATRKKGSSGRRSLQEDSSMSLHWDDYEAMNETERAQLLERAINVLTMDNKPTKNQSRWQPHDDDDDDDEDDDECSSFSS